MPYASEVSTPVYPIVLDMRGKRAVVVGGGPVAERKIFGLLEAQAEVSCVAISPNEAIEQLAHTGRVHLERRGYEERDLEGAALAFAATGDDATNARVVADARARNVLVNDASQGERGDFATPATVRAGSLLVTIDSGGQAPALVRQIREELAARFDARYVRATETLGRMREYVMMTLEPTRRTEVLRRLARLDLDVLAKMNPASAQHAVDELVATLGARESRPTKTFVCASRGSSLALTQARTVMARLAEAGVASTLETIATTGDRARDVPIAALGSDNVFVKELELALRDRRADYAVHSCKDLPGTLADDMRIAAITVREDARDAFCSERFPSFDALPSGARVGTSSPRRRAQLARLRPDLRYDEMRGNVDTRLRKLASGDYDAIVLAMAGLRRLGVRATHTVPFPPELLTPAVGQGALAVETRADDPLAESLHVAVADPPTELAVLAERAFLRAMRGGCRAPLGAFATYADGTLRLTAVAASPDGTRILRGERIGVVADPAGAEAIGTLVAEFLLSHGAADLIAPRPLAGVLFLLPRTQDRPSRIAQALREAGGDVVEAAGGPSAAAGLAGRHPSMILFPSSGSVAVLGEYLTSLRNGERRPLVAVMGPASAAAAQAMGFPPDVLAPEAEIASFVQAVTKYLLDHRNIR